MDRLTSAISRLSGQGETMVAQTAALTRIAEGQEALIAALPGRNDTARDRRDAIACNALIDRLIGNVADHRFTRHTNQNG